MASVLAMSLLTSTGLVAATVDNVRSGPMTLSVNPAAEVARDATGEKTPSETARAVDERSDQSHALPKDASEPVIPVVAAHPVEPHLAMTEVVDEELVGDAEITEAPAANDLPAAEEVEPDTSKDDVVSESAIVENQTPPADDAEDEPAVSPQPPTDSDVARTEPEALSTSPESPTVAEIDETPPTDDAASTADLDASLDADSLADTETTTPPMPVAEDIDLSEPVVLTEEPAPPAVQPEVELADETVETSDDDTEIKPPLVLLGEEVAPGTSARLSWSPAQHFDGISVPTPVLVVNGAKPGKTLCLTAAIHGDELNGIEIVRRVLYDLDPEDLNGTVIGVPIVNLQGFRRNSRYLPDRRDLNRFFPGKPGGSSAARMAHSFFSQVIIHCDALVDIHTGSFLRTNLPQLRADMSVPEVAELTEGFGATAVLHSTSADGTLRRAAVLAGIPAVTLETGEPSRLQDKEIEHGTKGIQTLLNKLKMTRRVRVWGDPEPVYYKSTWVRADDGGLLFSSVKLGQRVREGQVLGTITDPITNVRSELVSPSKGRVLGMALNQVVLPGFATFRIGIPSNEKEMVPSDPPPEAGPEQPAFDYVAPDQFTPDIPESVPSEVDLEDENS